MTASPAPSAATRPAPAFSVMFALTAFASAALVFLVEPMITKLLLPLLGGSPAVWNTCLAFFQIALLGGYAYAHLLQRLRSIRLQTIIHAAVLIAAGLALPLSVSHAFGEPSPDRPIRWLLGVLAVSIGGPFAALSATAPLVQSWFARSQAPGSNPYSLYAASNLGSLLALLAYPTVVEPFVRLKLQTLIWSVGYGVFFVLIVTLGIGLWRRGRAPIASPPASVAANRLATVARWWRRLLWVLLAAAPSSLMLGVTTYLSTDIASAPFLWVAPLALYLLSFIIAFQDRPAIAPGLALTLQAAAFVAAIATLYIPIQWFALQAALQLAAFFLTALVCHQGLAARRPPAARLTEFYLLVSLGGVLGGAFNAFLAPVLFSSVIEYPMVLIAASLVRPWGQGWLSRPLALAFGLGVLGLVGAVAADLMLGPSLGMLAGFGVVMVCAFVVRDRAQAFFLLCLGLLISLHGLTAPPRVLRTERSFFGVVRIIGQTVPGLGPAKLMAHGATLHGVQFAAPAYRCRPMLYYAPTTPIGQVFRSIEAGRPAIRIGAVGMGAGAVAAYVRPADRLRFFEIDPLVVRLASNPANFSYIHGCAQGPVDWVVGDARLTLSQQPAGQFDILLVDAFSSDSIPAHLLTVEALRGYLQVIRPDGVVIMHLSNRHLELTSSVAAMAKAVGGLALRQFYRPPAGGATYYDSAEDVVIIARDPKVLTAFMTDPRWRLAQAQGVTAWTDDYSNLLGAAIRGVGHNDAEARQFAIDAAQPPMLKPPEAATTGETAKGAGTIDDGVD